MWNNVLHGFSFLQSKHLLQLFVLILRILSVITLYFDMIKKKTISEATKSPKGVSIKEIRKGIEYQGRYCFVVFGALQRVIGAS